MDTNNVILSVIGRVRKRREFTLSELLSMDTVKTEENLLHACGDGVPKGRMEACRGVLLTDIINETDVVITGHNDTRKMYVVIIAEDGYRTVFSWQELFNTAVGEGVVVILEKGKRKLYEGAGAIDLFSSNDFLSGPRYVKKVSVIEIVMVDV